MRAILKLAIVSLFCCMAYFMVRLVVITIRDDNNKNNVVKEYLQQNKDTNYTASTSDLRIEHNAERNGMIGMYIYSTQNYRNLKGIACYTVLNFLDDNGNLLIGNRFKDDDGNFCFYAPPLTPETDNVTNEQRTFIPYEEFSLPEEGTVYYNCILTVYIENNKKQRTELATSAISRFHLSR